MYRMFGVPKSHVWLVVTPTLVVSIRHLSIFPKEAFRFCLSKIYSYTMLHPWKLTKVELHGTTKKHVSRLKRAKPSSRLLHLAFHIIFPVRQDVHCSHVAWILPQTIKRHLDPQYTIMHNHKMQILVDEAPTWWHFNPSSWADLRVEVVVACHVHLHFWR